MPDTVYWMTPLGWCHLVVFAIVVPLLALQSRRRILGPATPQIPRVRFYRSGAITLVACGLISLLAADAQDLALFPPEIRRPWVSLFAAVALYGGAVVVMRPYWRRAVERRGPHLRYFMPFTRAERMWWIALSLLAGVSEEITWRGVQPPLVAYVTGSPVAGAILSAAMFGAAHAMQGWRSATAIVLFALVFQGLVWLSGSLYLAMAVHAAYDVTAGFHYAGLGREFRYE